MLEVYKLCGFNSKENSNNNNNNNIHEVITCTKILPPKWQRNQFNSVIIAKEGEVIERIWTPQRDKYNNQKQDTASNKEKDDKVIERILTP